MNTYSRFLVFLILIFAVNTLSAQQVSNQKIIPDIISKYWQASWITPPNQSLTPIPIFSNSHLLIFPTLIFHRPSHRFN